MMSDNEFVPESPLRSGARHGLWFGLYLTVLYAASLFSRQLVLLNLLSLAMMAAVPFVVYRYMKADYIASCGRYSVGSLWLDGLSTVVCGSLIAGAFMLVYLRWINPTHLVDEWNAMADSFMSSPDEAMQAYGAQIRTALDNGFTMTPGVFTMSLIWLAGLSGSVLSLVLAPLVRSRCRRGKTPADPA